MYIKSFSAQLCYQNPTAAEDVANVKKTIVKFGMSLMSVAYKVVRPEEQVLDEYDGEEEMEGANQGEE